MAADEQDSPTSRSGPRCIAPLLAVMTLAMLGPACAMASGLSDLQFSDVQLVNRADLAELGGTGGLSSADAPARYRLLLKVEFTSAVDLPQFAMRRRAEEVAAKGYFCERPKDYAVLISPGTYWNGVRLWPNTPIVPAPLTAGSQRRYTYYVFLEVARKDSPEAIPPQIGFDFRLKADDVCFFLVGGSDVLGLRYKSNVVRIPASAIEQSIRNGS
jgi:hypothetical protein